jgi:polyphenol oxidase
VAGMGNGTQFILVPMNHPNYHRAPGSLWLVPEWPAPPNVHAVCTTRAGGVSGAPWDSCNLGTHVGDVVAHVQANRTLLQNTLAVNAVFMDQVHGQTMLELQPGMPHGLQADGAFTQRSGLACTVMVADCLPVLLCDTQGRMVAAVHAGWRGLAGQGGVGVLEQIYKRFMSLAPVKYDYLAIKIIAWLGPCIGPSAFEVGDEVRAAFVATLPGATDCFKPASPGKWWADLPGLARQRLSALGVIGIYGNDGSAPWCTVGNPLRFFSYRRDRVTGRQAACIWLD